MKKVIDVSEKVREDVKTIFKVSDQTVWNALTFNGARGMSPKAKSIRGYAMKSGGRERVVAEKNDTLFFDSAGSFKQYFENGSILEFDKTTGNATLWYDGKIFAMRRNVKVSEMQTLQDLAARVHTIGAESIVSKCQ